MIVSSYSFLDASTGDYQEEEVFYQEEEENFDHITTQGKLLPMQDRLMQVIMLQANTLARFPCAKLYKSKAPIFLFMLNAPIPSFYFTSFSKFWLSKFTFLIHDFTWFRYRVEQEHQS